MVLVIFLLVNLRRSRLWSHLPPRTATTLAVVHVPLFVLARGFPICIWMFIYISLYPRFTTAPYQNHEMSLNFQGIGRAPLRTPPPNRQKGGLKDHGSANLAPGKLL
ncbi:hypothetical protein F5Y01DRAFT_8769 [Xylaria sp. FL0043]|nr:hypothetical protein F5Y01DRAFT_8769 [Xylaria sp. FL0043]